jgi:copper chaperone CopZ
LEEYPAGVYGGVIREPLVVPVGPTCLDEENNMSVSAVYKVNGMSCGHCEGAVSGEISELPGVSSVKAVASTGEVTVVSTEALREEDVRAAVDEAGFELVGAV